jgi:hypothetical protein
MRRGEPSRRQRASDGFEPIVPLGAGLTTRRLRLPSDEAIRDLGLALSGYDGLASIHGDGERIVRIVTTDSLASELDALLAEIHRAIPFETLE